MFHIIELFNILFYYLSDSQIMCYNKRLYYTCILVYIVVVDYPNQDIANQMGMYYDLRYNEYYRRSKFIVGLSNANDDEIVGKIEDDILKLLNESREFIEEHDIKCDIKEELETPICRLILEKFPDLNMRELALCSMILWTIWDIGAAYYDELIRRIVTSYMGLFSGLNHLQDTIQALVHKGIVVQKIGYALIGKEQSKSKPFIHLTLSPELVDKGLKSISGNNIYSYHSLICILLILIISSTM